MMNIRALHGALLFCGTLRPTMKKKGAKIGVTKHVYLELLDADFLFVISDEKDFLELAKGIVAENRFPELKRMVDENPLPPTCRGRTFWFDGGGSIVLLQKTTSCMRIS